MRACSLLPVAAALLPPGITALLDRKEQRPSNQGLVSRANTPKPIPLSYSDGAWFVPATIGTGGQDLRLMVSSWIYNTWLPRGSSDPCTSDDGGCSHGSFNSDLSTTYVSDGDKYDMWYSDGVFFNDTFVIGNFDITNYTMVLGDNDATESYGAFGLGDQIVETGAGASPFLESAVAQGQLSTGAYSLWLNDQDNPGSLLLGAIDTAKFEGDLFLMKKYAPQVMVAITSVTANSSSGSDYLGTTDNLPTIIGVAIDFAYSVFSPDVAYDMWAIVGATYDGDKGYPTLPCSMKNSSGSFVIGLDGVEGPRIQIPMSQLVADDSTSGSSTSQNSDAQCEFLVRNNTDPFNFWLGQPFLLSAYVVFDLYNGQMGVAPAKHDSTETNIVPFEVHGAPIPSAVSVEHEPGSVATGRIESYIPLPTRTYAAADGFQILGSVPTAAGPAATGADGGDSTPGDGLSEGAKIGIGVGVSLGVVALAALGFLVWRILRKRRAAGTAGMARVPEMHAPAGPGPNRVEMSNEPYSPYVYSEDGSSSAAYSQPHSVPTASTPYSKHAPIAELGDYNRFTPELGDYNRITPELPADGSHR
ncbi:aspartic peptidase domain-containing protein [Xylariomycetidae sp. FL0641]|nr:aspartic peptidase domain-containing protein [Xylariomycetidae sp. FL0641]